MNWFSLFRHAQQHSSLVISEEKSTLLHEIERAHADWQIAYQRLDWVVEKDQIDYAIYALEAAEKKYEMLLKQAKRLHWENKAPLAKGG